MESRKKNFISRPREKETLSRTRAPTHIFSLFASKEQKMAPSERRRVVPFYHIGCSRSLHQRLSRGWIEREKIKKKNKKETEKNKKETEKTNGES
jgi:hypothetical protein